MSRRVAELWTQTWLHARRAAGLRLVAIGAGVAGFRLIVAPEGGWACADCGRDRRGHPPTHSWRPDVSGPS